MNDKVQNEVREIDIIQPNLSPTQVRMLNEFSQEVVDLLHDKGYLNPTLLRQQERWLETKGIPDLLINFITEFKSLEAAQEEEQ